MKIHDEITRPTKGDVTAELREFAREINGTVRNFRRDPSLYADLENASAIAAMAERAADSVDATDRPYVHPTTAKTISDFAKDINAIAESTNSEALRASLRVASQRLTAFVLRYVPTLTDDGYRFAGND